MIVVDSSAVLAVLLREPEGAAFRRVFATPDVGAVVSVAQALEISIKLFNRFGDEGEAKAPRLLSPLGLRVVFVDAEQWDVARGAFRRFGKGRHPAGLNFGDCFAYALAKANDAPLLFKGDDFSKTDIKVAVFSI